MTTHVAIRGLTAAALALFLQAPLRAIELSGYTVGYAVEEGASICSLATHAPIIQAPLFKSYNRNSMQWWYNLAEEAAFSNVNFIALNFRGDSPCGLNNPPAGGEPTSYASNLVSAINQRGYSGFLKVGLFDDTGAYSWHVQACTGSGSFDLGNQAYWQSYFWDTRWKQFFNRVPDANRMKVNGRPLVIMWSVAPGLGFYNHAGNLRPLIEFLRANCQTTFGFNPFIVVDGTWLDEDPAVGAVVDGVHRWFDVGVGNPWSLYTHNGPSGTFTTGVANPGFWVPSAGLFRDRSAGDTLRTALANISTANLAIFEGLTDVEENAGFYRGAALCNPSCGGPSPPAGQCWAYANQYLNIVREAVWDYPLFVDFEAEACDDYQVSRAVRSGLYRRDGNLDIAYADASQSRWSVRLKSNNWVQFRSFQMGASSNYQITVRYAAQASASARLVVDGVQTLAFTLGPTGSLSTYVTTQIAAPFALSAGNHDIRFEVTNGDMRVDFWRLSAP